MIGKLNNKQKMVVFFGVIMGMLLSALDTTIVSTAMPKILSSLGGVEHLSWVTTAYMLTSTISVLIFGKISDLYGRKPFYIIGIIIFLIGSALCGISNSMIELVLFRGLQGIGGGIMMSNSMAIVADIFSPQERASKQGIIGGVFGVSGIVGPAVGGLITDSLSWRWVFYINIPVGLIAIIILFIGLPFVKDDTEKSIDYLGIIFIITTFVPLLLAFSWAGSMYDWISKEIIGLLLFSLISLIILIFIENKAKEPIMQLNLFKNKTFNICVISGLLMSIIMLSTEIYMPLFIQGVMGASASNSGMCTTPMMISTITASIVSGKIISKTGKYYANMVAGFIVMSIGMYLLSTMNISTTYFSLITNIIILGIGLGLALPIFVTAVQNEFPIKIVGTVTASLTFFRNIGGTIGVALLGSVLNIQFKNGSMSIIPESINSFISNAQQKTLETPQSLFGGNMITQITNSLPSQLSDTFLNLLDNLKNVLANSIHTMFIICVMVAIIGFITVLFLPRKTLKDIQDEK